MAKGEKVEIRMTTEEKAELYGRAEELDMKPTEYVRMLLFDPPKVPVDTVASEPAITAPKPFAPLPEPSVPRKKLNYTGAHAIMFHQQQYEYEDERGVKLWTTTPPF